MGGKFSEAQSVWSFLQILSSSVYCLFFGDITSFELCYVETVVINVRVEINEKVEIDGGYYRW